MRWGNIYERIKVSLSPTKIFISFTLLLLALMLQESFLPLFVIAILYAIDIGFDFILRYTLRPIYQAFPAGIELVTFNTAMAGIALGPIAGIFAGLLFGATYYGIIFNFNSTYQVINIPAYGLIGYLAGTLSMTGATLGITLSLIYGVTTSLFIFTIFRGRLYKCLVFIITNVLFNYWIFSNFSPVVLNIIS